MSKTNHPLWRAFSIACLLITVGAAILSVFVKYRTEAADLLLTAKCSMMLCEDIAPDQLRVKVLKAYLHITLDRAQQHRGFGGDDRVVLLPTKMGAIDIENAIMQETLLKVLQQGALQIVSHQQIDQLEQKSLVEFNTIGAYAVRHRYANIVSTESIVEAEIQDIETYEAAKGATMPRFRWQERLFGYGKKFFWIKEYGHLSLACCDGNGGERELSKEWLKQNSVSNARISQRRILAVSPTGNVFIRGGEQEFSYVYF